MVEVKRNASLRGTKKKTRQKDSTIGPNSERKKIISSIYKLSECEQIDLYREIEFIQGRRILDERNTEWSKQAIQILDTVRIMVIENPQQLIRIKNILYEFIIYGGSNKTKDVTSSELVKETSSIEGDTSLGAIDDLLIGDYEEAVEGE